MESEATTEAASPTVSMQIPRILHQSWKSENAVPEMFVPWMRSWVAKHPTWKYVFWDDNANLALFHTHFPQYAHIASSLKKIHLADMARYALLYIYGGVYVDCDFECTAPLDDLLGEELFLSTEPFVHAVLLERATKPILCNAILASRPRHPFWLEVLDAVRTQFTVGGPVQDPVSLTGPRLVEAVYNRYSNPAGRVTVFPEEYFYPEIAYWNIGLLNELCLTREDAAGREACAWLQKNPKGAHTANTHAVHHWQCTWCRAGLSQIVTNLTTIFPTHPVVRPRFSKTGDEI
ncbi:hypothetical protein ACHHYP_00127 [Achlya hypogyna]|uniref:Uncharacterized protein n=1 Tax=Achlya hypogyna TaxID=1202772 RepID=A0A1V9ZBC6_ACHHY|nr:hypothetical protein ACHHYP_00127 [Achlya hypogyna]